MGLATRRSGACDPSLSQSLAGRSQPRLRRSQDLPEHRMSQHGTMPQYRVFQQTRKREPILIRLSTFDPYSMPTFNLWDNLSLPDAKRYAK
jgi:hypothetical protein